MGMKAVVISSDPPQLWSRILNLLLSSLGSQFKTHCIRGDGKLAKKVNPPLKEQKMLSYGETER